MDDLIERAEDAVVFYQKDHYARYKTSLIRELTAALKAAHKEIDWLHGELDRMRVRGDY